MELYSLNKNLVWSEATPFTEGTEGKSKLIFLNLTILPFQFYFKHAGGILDNLSVSAISIRFYWIPWYLLVYSPFGSLGGRFASLSVLFLCFLRLFRGLIIYYQIILYWGYWNKSPIPSYIPNVQSTK